MDFTPREKHQLVRDSLFSLLKNRLAGIIANCGKNQKLTEVQKNGLANRLLVGPDLEMALDNLNLVRPDLVLLAGDIDFVPGLEYIDSVGGPESIDCTAGIENQEAESSQIIRSQALLVAEVLSGPTLVKDKREKRDLYMEKGVKEYLIAYPDSEYIEHYSLIDGRYYPPQIVAKGEMLRLEHLEISLAVDQIFSF